MVGVVVALGVGGGFLVPVPARGARAAEGEVEIGLVGARAGDRGPGECYAFAVGGTEGGDLCRRR